MPTPKAKKQKNMRSSGRTAPELIFGNLWNFDPAPETADPKVKATYDLFIDGKWTQAKSKKRFDSINPANEKKIAEIALAGPLDVNLAYLAAGRAQKSWARTPGK